MVSLACGDRCRTDAGAQRHAKASEPLCEACRLARNEYRRFQRQWNPETRSKNRATTRASYAAHKRLREAHPAEYEQYYQEERFGR
jgi:hypothetical protein